MLLLHKIRLGKLGTLSSKNVIAESYGHTPSKPCFTRRFFASTSVTAPDSVDESIEKTSSIARNPLPSTPLHYFLSYCESMKASAVRGVSMKSFADFLKKSHPDKRREILASLKQDSMFQRSSLKTDKIALRKAYEQAAELKNLPLHLRCDILVNTHRIEEYAKTISPDGISRKELVQQLATVIPQQTEALFALPSPESIFDAFPHLWLYDARKGLYFSVFRRLSEHVQPRIGDGISFRGFRTLLQTHFPAQWVINHSPEMLCRASNYSLIVCAREKSVYKINWAQTLKKASELLEKRFQQCIAESQGGTVLSRKIPLNSFSDAITIILPWFSSCMPSDFTLHEFIAKNFADTYDLTLSTIGDYEIEPKGAPNPFSFEQQAIKVLRGSSKEPHTEWVNVEAIFPKLEKADTEPLRPADFGAKGWIELLESSKTLEYTITLSIRERKTE